MKQPTIISGGAHQDPRGTLRYNNNFDASKIKRIYTVSNSQELPIRGWQGHKIESRWFSCIQGSFNIALISIKDWENPVREVITQEFKMTSMILDVLHVPPGYISSIESLENDSTLLAMSDYGLGEVVDEYRYDLEYFNVIINS